MSNGSVKTLYYLLFARYGSTHINSDYPEQWKMKIMATIFKYGPTWSKRLELQDKIRAMSDNDIVKGDIAIYNNALNPDTEPTTETWDTLKGINGQNTTLRKRGKLESYALVDNLLQTDVTEDFLSKFKKFFNLIASPQRTLLYDLSDTFPTDGNFDTVIGSTDIDIFGNYMTNTFEEMFPTAQDFIDYYKNCGIPTTIPEV